jgi:hypothetical protein
MRPADRNIFEITEEASREDHPIAVADLGDSFPAGDFQLSESGTEDRLKGAEAAKRSAGASGRKGRKKALVAAVLVAGVPALGMAVLSSGDGQRSPSRAQVGPERPATDRTRAQRAAAVSVYGRRRRHRPALAAAPRRSRRSHLARSNGSVPGPRQHGPGSSRSVPIQEPRPEASAGLSPPPAIWRSASVAPTGGEASEFSFER